MGDLITNESMGKFILLVIAFLIFYSYNSGGSSNSNINKINSEDEIQKQNKIKELENKIQREELKINNLILKYKEIEQEINDLLIESSMDLEKEEKNSLKIEKLQLNQKHININISKETEKLTLLKNELNKLLG